jgi:methionine sulfoxide reductase heme-binding subunit
VLLVATLALTPLRRVTGWNRLISVRRLVGLFAFFYATLHFLTYVLLDRYLEFGEVIGDILQRPYITAGFTAYLLLVPLAVTSTRGWIRRLGRRWGLLHRLVYVAAALAVLHFYWKRASKADIGEPLTFATVLALLLAARLAWWLVQRHKSPRRAT